MGLRFGGSRRFRVQGAGLRAGKRVWGSGSLKRAIKVSKFTVLKEAQY